MGAWNGQCHWKRPQTDDGRCGAALLSARVAGMFALFGEDLPSHRPCPMRSSLTPAGCPVPCQGRSGSEKLSSLSALGGQPLSGGLSVGRCVLFACGAGTLGVGWLCMFTVQGS